MTYISTWLARSHTITMCSPAYSRLAARCHPLRYYSHTKPWDTSCPLLHKTLVRSAPSSNTLVRSAPSSGVSGCAKQGVPSFPFMLATCMMRNSMIHCITAPDIWTYDEYAWIWNFLYIFPCISNRYLLWSPQPVYNNKKCARWLRMQAECGR